MPAEAPSGLIWNPILRQHQVSAAHRMNRREGTALCPFCADVEHGRVSAGAQAWLHPNDYPPLRPPHGEAVVVIYSRDHDRTLTQLTPPEVVAVARLWQQLYCDLASRYAVVMIFENSGGVIGQTQFHPHGQAYGVSVIPPLLAREHDTVLLEAAGGRGCPFCGVCASLDEDGYRVAENTGWRAYVPPYARYPYETHLYPRRHMANLALLDAGELAGLAELLLRVVRAYNVLQGGALAPMPYMWGLHQLADERFHLHLEILPIGRAAGKLKYAAAGESLWSLWVNDAAPLQKAAELREALSTLHD